LSTWGGCKLLVLGEKLLSSFPFRGWTRVFHDLLRENPFSLFELFYLIFLID
jgi:hypothetical protein